LNIYGLLGSFLERGLFADGRIGCGANPALNKSSPVKFAGNNFKDIHPGLTTSQTRRREETRFS